MSQKKIKKMSTYPRRCDCCNPQKVFKNKQGYYYHINLSKDQMSKGNTKAKSEIDETVLKKAKIEDHETDEKKWLNSNINFFIKLVGKHHDTNMLESNISVMEEDLKEDFKIKISELCFQEIAKWDQTLITHPEETLSIRQIKVK